MKEKKDFFKVAMLLLAVLLGISYLGNYYVEKQYKSLLAQQSSIKDQQNQLKSKLQQHDWFRIYLSTAPAYPRSLLAFQKAFLNLKLVETKNKNNKEYYILRYTPVSGTIAEITTMFDLLQEKTCPSNKKCVFFTSLSPTVFLVYANK